MQFGGLYWSSYCDGAYVKDLIEEFLRGQGIYASVTNIQDAPRYGTDNGIMGNIRVDHIEPHANLNLSLARIINQHLKLTVGVSADFRISNVERALARRPSRHKRVRE